MKKIFRFLFSIFVVFFSINNVFAEEKYVVDFSDIYNNVNSDYVANTAYKDGYYYTGGSNYHWTSGIEDDTTSYLRKIDNTGKVIFQKDFSVSNDGFKITTDIMITDKNNLFVPTITKSEFILKMFDVNGNYKKDLVTLDTNYVRNDNDFIYKFGDNYLLFVEYGGNYRIKPEVYIYLLDDEENIIKNNSIEIENSNQNFFGAYTLNNMAYAFIENSIYEIDSNLNFIEHKVFDESKSAIGEKKLIKKDNYFYFLYDGKIYKIDSSTYKYEIVYESTYTVDDWYYDKDYADITLYNDYFILSGINNKDNKTYPVVDIYDSNLI